MPTNLTDVDAFTSPVVAPTDGDAGVAASVATGLQILANRTRFLNNKRTAPTARTMRVPLVLSGTNWAMSIGGSDPLLVALASATGAIAALQLPRLPRGSVIRSVSINVIPSDVRSGSNRIAAALYRTNNLGVSSTVYAAVFDNGTSNQQYLALPAVASPHTYSDAHNYFLLVTAGGTGTPGDQVVSVSIEFDDYTLNGEVSP